MSKNVRNLMDKETPFKVIKINGFEIRLYWSPNRGQMGYQCTVIIFSKAGFCFEFKTNGYGYCKESHALTYAFKFLGFAPRNLAKQINGHCESNDLFTYKVGGNFYNVLKKDVLKLKK